MSRSGWLSLVLGTSAAAFVLLPMASGVESRDGGTATSIPDRLAGYSYLTGNVSDAPPGRAVALYQHGFGVEFMDYPQAVVLAADDDLYRRLDAAEDRGGSETQGDPGPMLLSPDGLWVALGDHDTHDADLGVVDLRTGGVTSHQLPDARSVVPIAWSRDGSRVAYLSGDDQTNPYSGQRLAGDLFVLDLASGNATPVPGDSQAWAAAFSPDGHQLAVQRASAGASGDLSILDLSEGTVRPLTVRGVLAGPAAWSPDGRLLAVSGSSGLSFVDPLGSGPASAPHLTVEGPRWVLGWTGAREVATFETDFDVARLVAHPLDGSRSRELASIGNQGSYGVGTFQLASALVADVQVRAAGGPDRGPLPPVFRFALATVVGLVVAGLAALVARRRHSH